MNIQALDIFKARVIINGWLHDPAVEIEGIYLGAIPRGLLLHHRTWLFEQSLHECAMWDTSFEKTNPIAIWNEHFPDTIVKILGRLSIEEALTHPSIEVRQATVHLNVQA